MVTDLFAALYVGLHTDFFIRTCTFQSKYLLRANCSYEKYPLEIGFVLFLTIKLIVKIWERDTELWDDLG